MTVIKLAIINIILDDFVNRVMIIVSMTIISNVVDCNFGSGIILIS